MGIQQNYIIFVVIPRSNPQNEGYSFSTGIDMYREYTAIFSATSVEEAEAITALLNEDYEGISPGEDFPEGFVVEFETEMSTADRVRAHKQLANLNEWQLDLQRQAREYVQMVRDLPPAVREEKVSGDDGKAPSTSPDAKDYCFRKAGAMWEIGDGCKTYPFPDHKGLRIIYRLLVESDEDRPIPSITLQAEYNEPRGSRETKQTIRDSKDRQVLKNKIEDAESQLNNAKANGAMGQIEKYDKRLKELLLEWEEMTGWRGRLKQMGPKSPDDKARLSVRIAIHRAIGKIKEYFPELAQHFKDKINTGYNCYYPQDSKIRWRTY